MAVPGAGDAMVGQRGEAAIIGAGKTSSERRRISRVLITDSTYKHSIALARYLKRDIPGLHLTGWTRSNSRLAQWYSCFDETIRGTSLENVLGTHQFDMVIPVGGVSVLEASRLCPELAVLPEPAQLEVCYDKTKTIAFAQQAGVPVPETFFIKSAGETIPNPRSFPCVVKPAREATRWKGVEYCRSYDDLKSAVEKQLKKLESDSGVGVLVQEYIPGQGHGFFALMNHGVPLRVFMHQRLREFPHTGGASCAARSFWSPRLEELGLKLLRALEWNGVAMVEFKQDARTGEFVLMEINAKFWGSLELALAAGVNFGADLIRLYRGDELVYSDEYDRDRHFYWPLDGDLETLWATRSLGKIRDYWQPHSFCDVGGSLRADLYKIAALIKHLLLR